jgi:hypothetical protein
MACATPGNATEGTSLLCLVNQDEDQFVHRTRRSSLGWAPKTRLGCERRRSTTA